MWDDQSPRYLHRAIDDYFSADGTLIKAWALMKSFLRKDVDDATKVDKGKDDDPGNPTISFEGNAPQRRASEHGQSGIGALPQGSGQLRDWKKGGRNST